MPSTLRDRGLPPDRLIDVIEAQTEIAKLGPDLGAVMALVAGRVKDLTGAGGAIVELAEGDEMVYRAASGIAQAQLGLRLPRQGSLSGLCVDTGRILHCEDSETDPRVDRDACRRVGLRSMLVVPLRHHDSPVGVLKVAWAAEGAFTDQDVGILELMSELIAASMYQAARVEKDELYHRATHDPLTGLANRALFCDRLRQSIASAERRRGSHGVLILDMDGLKPINDRHGHRAGDAAIRETAGRIRRVLRKADTAARLGGDEFGVVLSDVADRQAVHRSAERIVEEVRQPFRFEDQPLDLHVSVGGALFPEDGVEMDALIEVADRAMYHVKRKRYAMGRVTPPARTPPEEPTG
ncbi:GGDEF domain-containing protein [Azospirillum sp. RWY-5-1]|uniref:GGDEF domain-containing protein n=1 Tax=Azospirillum oleiclasticum TaxID=2735135 RepID=A0ABX2TC88_9PROT|nr:sensor domain-containing diguanylate cyclase [Azospirillum oleiclasticum]NYZ13623.1 GGDEF domain-containing protein [Azospirillum oleiclasticum]NYZ20783.1 GGDEF domain-containing protein [Azospirillum oleiclasticum]